MKLCLFAVWARSSLILDSPKCSTQEISLVITNATMLKIIRKLLVESRVKVSTSIIICV